MKSLMAAVALVMCWQIGAQAKGNRICIGHCVKVNIANIVGCGEDQNILDPAKENNCVIACVAGETVRLTMPEARQMLRGKKAPAQGIEGVCQTGN